jgi:endonuclease/exonuclease/phosphatase family metal-dependent hydrolase
MKNKLDLKTHIDVNIMIVGDFNTSLSPTIGHPHKNNQQRNFRIEGHHRSNGPDRHLQGIPSCNNIKHVLFSTFSKIDHIIGHKANLNKFKKIEISPCILSDHNGIKLELNNKRISRKCSNNWRLNNMLLHD